MEQMNASRRLALALFLAVSAGSALAQEPRTSKARMEEAQSRFQRGKELYEENDFQAALTEFRRAYEIVGNYKLLYNIGQVSYQLQDYAGALKSFSRYLQESQGEVNPARREEVQREIDKLRVRVATLRITVSEPQAEVSIDDVPVGRSPLPESVMVNAGRRKVTATLAGRPPATRIIDVAGQDTAKVSLELEPVAGAARATPTTNALAPTSVTTEPPAQLSPWIPWTATGALAVATGVTATLAGAASAEQKTKLATFGATRAELDSAAAKTRGLALTTDILGALTVVAAGVSTYLTLTGEPPKPGSASLHLGVSPGGASLAGTF